MYLNGRIKQFSWTTHDRSTLPVHCAALARTYPQFAQSPVNVTVSRSITTP
jgi:hypothetical protein